ncbi:MAG TPA: hypothetical protein VJI68_01340 [Candidatus Nanoarchaeia archaeon]|nr:hypothetical protein [Candidatus Nanoarchaeia archaeon]
MGLFTTLAFYLILVIGIIVFLKLDKRFSILNRLLIAVAATLVLVFLFAFISTIIAIILILILVVLLISFLERKNVKLGKIFFKK